MCVYANASPRMARQECSILCLSHGLHELIRTVLSVADLVVNAAKIAEEAVERFDLSC